MGAKLDLLSLSHLQNPNPNLSGSGTGSGSVFVSGAGAGTDTGTGSWMWTPRQPMASQDDDDSWEVRAFAEDTGNAMGTTWPPRSYTCTFCRREFRSAQALGGHMNVHRRDRARLHQTQPINSKNATSSSSSPTLLIPTHQDLVANGGLCLLYSLPNPNGLFSPSSFHNYREPPSTFLSITQYPPTNNFMPPSPHHIPPVNFPVNINTSHCHSSNSEASASVDNDNKHESNDDNKEDSAIEELDLELRLGRSS